MLLITEKGFSGIRPGERKTEMDNGKKETTIFIVKEVLSRVDHKSLFELVVRVMENLVNVEEIETVEKAMEALESGKPDILVFFSRELIEVAQRIKIDYPEMRVIVFGYHSWIVPDIEPTNGLIVVDMENIYSLEKISKVVLGDKRAT